MDVDNDILTVNDAAAMFRVKPTTIRRWVEQRRIPFFYLGRLVRFRRVALLDWAAELERATGAENHRSVRERKNAQT